MSKTKKLWLAIAMICCVAPATFADHNHGCGRDPRDCHQQSVPEGGTAAIYILGVGLTCAGAMLLRSRIAKQSTQS
jgi:hypothetical protein